MNMFKEFKFIILVLIVLSGCSTNSTDEFERTYPQAFNFETATIQQLIDDEITPPDSLNFEIFVVGINKCPKDNLCFAPDGIFVSESPIFDTSEEEAYIYVREPRQFTEGEQYTISLGVTLNPSGTRRRVELIGYSFANQIIDDF